MKKFHIRMDEDIFGPYTAKEILALDLLPDIMVTEVSMDSWLPAGQFDFKAIAKQELLDRMYPVKTNLTGYKLQINELWITCLIEFFTSKFNLIFNMDGQDVCITINYRDILKIRTISGRGKCTHRITLRDFKEYQLIGFDPIKFNMFFKYEIDRRNEILISQGKSFAIEYTYCNID